MKTLLVISHPNPKSFSFAVKDKLYEYLIQNGDEVRQIDLYKDDFDPVLRSADFERKSQSVLEYQSMIKWAKRLVFIYPLWWGQMPAMLKGFMDKMLSHGFAFDVDDEGYTYGKLTDKEVLFVVNLGMDAKSQEKLGMVESVKRSHLFNNFGFCGVPESACNIRFFNAVPHISPELRQEYLESLKDLI